VVGKNWRREILTGVVVLSGLAVAVAAWAQGAGGKFSPPDVTAATDIAFPMDAAKAGMVSFLVGLDASGDVQHLSVLQDTPPLTAAARAGVQNWGFKAAMVNGSGVAANFPVHVVFNPYNPGGTSVSGGGPRVPPAVPSNLGNFMPPQVRMASFAFYPPNTQAQGTVVLSVNVDKSGHVGKITVVHGVQPLVDAATEAVKQWGFQPAMRGGETAAGRLCVAFVFQRNLS
jgi:TonB family protein